MNEREREPTLKERVEIFRAAYVETIKPAIVACNYFGAFGELGNHIHVLERDERQMYGEIHCAGGVMAAARVLQQKLEAIVFDNAKPDIDHIIEMLEAYMAQTKLPMRPR